MKSTIKLSAVLFFVAVFGAVAGFSQGEKVALLNTNSGTQTASPRDAATDDLRVNARVLDSTSTGVGSALDHTTTGVDSVLGHTSPDATVKSNAGNVQVVNSVCVPQGPGPCSQPRQSKKSGHDGFSCPTKNLQGGNIRGTCKAGVCTAIAPSSCTTPSFTSSADSLKSGGFLGQLGQQFFSQLLQKLMGGGGAAGGGGGNSTPNFGNTQPAEDFLQIDPNLLNLSDTGLGLDNLIFGDSSATTNIASDTTNTTRNTETNTDTARETVVVENTPGQEGDTVETTYENIGTDNNNAAAENSTAANTSDDFNDDFFEDNSDFDRDFFGANLDASDGSVSNVSGLSRAELEAQGLLEASRLGSSDIARSGSLAIQYESLTSAEVRTLQDFRSSAVSGGLSPFQGLNEQPDTKNGSDEQGAGFFKKITNFFSALLGFGPPQR